MKKRQITSLCFFKRKQIKKSKNGTNIQLNDLQCAIIEDVKEYVLSHWKLNDLHGLPHWQNVAKNGLMLAKETNANPFVTQLFAYLHDSCRIDDGADFEHGERASELVSKLKDTLLKSLSSQEHKQLYLACKYHTTELRLNDATIDTCFDADRLDLVRLGILLNPERMATKTGCQLAEEYSMTQINKRYIK
ncbi:hypothetical protein LJC68_07460 [Bacteroidales bacterium OttesenSCG-928-B11]|nr:hypothetical protein [Bacteroidales bacterium OttesenSCG-928-C03]MDL2312697.1 hypothetical protein [Bacteroidales bacterium OttesenSCG-928-B11]